jgi:uncharacterized membrane protein
MKHLTGMLAVVAAAMLVGCNEGTPGGNVANAPTTDVNDPNDSTHTVGKPAVGNADDTFTLDVPTLSTSLKQGETKTVSIGIDRGDNFDQDVTVRMSDIPQGLTITPEEPMIGHGDEEVSLSISASGDAALGDFIVQLSGQPARSGTAAKNELKITVEKSE